MATYYIDFEGGNDASAGTSFATRWKTITSGATAARTAPGDVIRIMGSPAPTLVGNATFTSMDVAKATSGGAVNGHPQTYSVSTTSPIVATSTYPHYLETGDLVFFTGAPTTANGTWKIVVTGAHTFELWNLNGTASIGSTAGSQISTAGYITNRVITLTVPVTQTIACSGNYAARTPWTMTGSHVYTQALSNIYGQYGRTSYGTIETFQFTTGSTIGKIAYLPLSSTLNLSGYQQVSFYFYFHSTYASPYVTGDVQLKLCSDAAGATPVNSINVPAPSAQGAGFMLPVTVDTGGALGSSIQSIAIYVNTDRGSSFSFGFDSIMACKASGSADSLTLTSLVGKNTVGEPWYPIANIINDQYLVLGNANSQSEWTVNDAAGYVGVEGSFPLYKRETIKIPLDTISNFGMFWEVQEAGTAGNLISYEGGWDRTSMSTQNLETWIDGQMTSFVGLDLRQSYVSVNKLSFVHCNQAFQIAADTSATAQGIVIDNAYAVSCSNAWTINNAPLCSIGVTGAGAYNSIFPFTLNNQVYNNTYVGGSAVLGNFYIKSASGGAFGSWKFGGMIATNLVIQGCTGFGFLAKDNVFIDSLDCSYNFTHGVLFQAPVQNFNCNSLTTIGNCWGVCSYAGAASGRILSWTSRDNIFAASVGFPRNLYVRNGAIDDVVKLDLTHLTESTGGASGSNGQPRLAIENYNNTGLEQIITDLGLITSQTSIRHTAAGIAWQLSPTSIYATEKNPLRLSVVRTAVRAGEIVTMTAWLYRDSPSLTLRLNCRSSQLRGIDGDVIAVCSGVANAWEQLTLQFTPAESGGVEIVVEAWGGTGFNGYIDDVTIASVAPSDPPPKMLNIPPSRNSWNVYQHPFYRQRYKP